MNKALNHPAGGYVPPADAPDWFAANLARPGESRVVAVDDGEVHFLGWNWDDTSLPALLLVHGYGGHAHWWSFLAPFFADRYRVAAIDLPGMGDSSPRAVYDDDCFAQGILAVMDQSNLGRAAIVGHSFGGAQAMRAMAMAPQRFVHGVIVDTLVHFPPKSRPRLLDGKHAHRIRASREACIRDFRLMPPQPAVIPALMNFIAHHSCTPAAGGWHWKFDPGLRNYAEITTPDLLRGITTPVDCIYGERSLFADEDRPRRVLESFANHGELVLVADAYHHLMLDHPLELVAAMSRLLDKHR